jgi:hypothetical protein
MSDEPQITRGLLDVLVLTPVADLGGTLKFLDVRVKGLSGFRVTLEVAAVQELRQVMDSILGPQAPTNLALLLLRYFEIYDKPCEPNGDWPRDEYQALDARLRKLVGAPSKNGEPCLSG